MNDGKTVRGLSQLLCDQPDIRRRQVVTNAYAQPNSRAIHESKWWRRRRTAYADPRVENSPKTAPSAQTRMQGIIYSAGFCRMASACQRTHSRCVTIEKCEGLDERRTNCLQFAPARATAPTAYRDCECTWSVIARGNPHRPRSTKRLPLAASAARREPLSCSLDVRFGSPSWMDTYRNHVHMPEA